MINHCNTTSVTLSLFFLPSEETSASSASGRKTKTLNLFMVKFHFLGDYVRHIRLFGTTDSYSTQLVSQLTYHSGAGVSELY